MFYAPTLSRSQGPNVAATGQCLNSSQLYCVIVFLCSGIRWHPPHETRRCFRIRVRGNILPSCIAEIRPLQWWHPFNVLPIVSIFIFEPWKISQHSKHTALICCLPGSIFNGGTIKLPDNATLQLCALIAAPWHILGPSNMAEKCIRGWFYEQFKWQGPKRWMIFARSTRQKVLRHPRQISLCSMFDHQACIRTLFALGNWYEIFHACGCIKFNLSYTLTEDPAHPAQQLRITKFCVTQYMYILTWINWPRNGTE